jgi:hypothetical protein
MTKENYQKYLKSEWWSVVRKEMLKLFPACQQCDFPYELNVHHKTYERLWKEKIPDDLEVLCQSCHSRHHFAADVESGLYRDFIPLDDRNRLADKIRMQTRESREKNSNRELERRRFDELQKE